MKPLSSVLQFIFGCRHRHLSRVFTIKHRTYKVCFDCGREFDLPSIGEPAQPGARDTVRATTSPRMPTGASGSSTPSTRRADVNRGM
jgi:hypothetical protein